MKIVIVTPCATAKTSFSRSPNMIEVEDVVARDLLRAGYAMLPGDAKKEAAPKTEKAAKPAAKTEKTAK